MAGLVPGRIAARQAATRSSGPSGQQCQGPWRGGGGALGARCGSGSMTLCVSLCSGTP